MSLSGRLFASLYDATMSAVEAGGLGEHRRDLLAEAKGSVLEIGAGTGANVALYSDGVDELTLTEPEPAMLHRLQRRIRLYATHALVLRAPAEDLPFTDDTFDAAVSTLVLCSVDDQPRALRELRRVLRPGGALLFIEHLRSGDPGTARLQDRLNWLNRLDLWCDCNRPTLDSNRAVCFTVGPGEHSV